MIDNIFAYNVAIDIMQPEENFEPKSVHKCRQSIDWPKWKDAIQAELSTFVPQEKDEDLLGDETPYLSAVGRLMYLANKTRPDICFAVRLVARSSSSQQEYIEMVLNTYFDIYGGTMDMGLFYSNESKSKLIGYADAEYLSDHHKARSQIGYLFTCEDTAISWRSMKQTLLSTSSNHGEIIVIH
ncbi:secreted RxLR effector protein 161-like [Solanum lycopersicum]|uniref:secreted RxLR effector protein 161-like n=1 Tax=Solanum lycopersicum TaxID=4081 RepID=UPI003748AB6C